jgi:copper oxidase (laccase) domain-containing protein
LGAIVGDRFAQKEFAMNFGARTRFMTIGALALLATAPAIAQDSYRIDPQIAAQLQAIGPVVKVPEAAKIFLPAQEKASKEGVKHTDISKRRKRNLAMRHGRSNRRCGIPSLTCSARRKRLEAVNPSFASAFSAFASPLQSGI